MDHRIFGTPIPLSLRCARLICGLAAVVLLLSGCAGGPKVEVHGYAGIRVESARVRPVEG